MAWETTPPPPSPGARSVGGDRTEHHPTDLRSSRRVTDQTGIVTNGLTPSEIFATVCAKLNDYCSDLATIETEVEKHVVR